MHLGARARRSLRSVDREHGDFGPSHQIEKLLTELKNVRDDKAITALSDSLDGLDIVVNCAGVIRRGDDGFRPNEARPIPFNGPGPC